MSAANKKRKTFIEDRVAKIKELAGAPDTNRVLFRIAALLEGGETAESIMTRLNPPARRPEKTTGWFVGDD